VSRAALRLRETSRNRRRYGTHIPVGRYGFSWIGLLGSVAPGAFANLAANTNTNQSPGASATISTQGFFSVGASDGSAHTLTLSCTGSTASATLFQWYSPTLMAIEVAQLTVTP
jgi:hypothetical protein